MTVRRVVLGVGALMLFGPLSGCGSGRPVPQQIAAVVPIPVPDGMQDPAELPRAGTDPGCEPAGSLRPVGPLPAPGHPPPGAAIQRILTRGRLVVGVDQNLNRFGFLRKGELVGYDVDYAKEIARAIFGDPARVQFRAVNSADRIQVLNSGQVDLIADSMTITCERQRQVLFSTDYFDSGQRVLVRSDAPYRGIGDLGGKKVCAPKSTTSIRTIAEHPAHPVPVSVLDWTDCLVLLQQGAVEAISTTDSILIGLREQDPGTKIVGDRFTLEPHGLAVRRSEPELVRFVNAVLQQMRLDGRWRAVYTRWLGDLGRSIPQPPPARYAAERGSHAAAGTR